MASNDPKWTAKVPEPEVSVVYEDGKYRAEIINYVEKADRVKDVRVRGPLRSLKKEARKDCAELRRASLKAGYDASLFAVRVRRKELESVKWKAEDLVGPDVEDKEEEERERRLKEKYEERMRKEKEEEEKKRKEQTTHEDARAARLREQLERFKPVGPNWKKPGSMVQLPMIGNSMMGAWMIHEKMDGTGKYRPWLYFNAANGKYYQQREDTRFVQIGEPHNPRELGLTVRVGSASLLSRAGRKLDMAVLLPELHKTGFLLKQSLEFLDKPASLFVLCDGLRNSAAASEFCARRFHTILLPKLSARASDWEDFEFADLLRDAAEALDSLVLESPQCFSGCGLAVALQVGSRLVLGALGGVRCLVCRPASPAGTTASRPNGAAGRAAAASSAAAAAQWTATLVAGGDAHTVASDDERLRVESAGNRILDGCNALCAGSATAAALEALPDEKERILVEVARASSSFATLRLKPDDLKEGAGAIRRIFRKRSLVVHPDKVGEAFRLRAVPVFAKLEAAATAVEGMLNTDAAAARLVCEICTAHDEGRLGADPAAAARLLGVAEGSDAKAVKEAVKRKFHAPLGRLQHVGRRDVERAFQTIEVAENTIARGSTLWTPNQADEGVQVTRALGCRDLKFPAPLLTSGLQVECVELTPGAVVGVALLADGANSVPEAEVAQRMARHSPSRPRAAALRIALRGAEQASLSAIGAVCAYFDYDSANGRATSSSVGQPSAKRLKTGGKPERVRISHVLLRWAGLKGEDGFARPGLEPATRTQAEAERELLELLEALLAGDPKTLGTRFKAEVLKKSECASALNVPYADLGWMEPGVSEASLEAAAFDTPIGGLSDVVLSSRGAHLMYRMA
eukprot:TRINITY_DN22977_c0_g1_i1.p1 TRINITY_DN22977_c0_g1~~TRINITY_DN22977_c0_g1_i1.p1  ORF type:complete len:861 (-),score=206.69 TRINITY_DN22977_c0_g1_i1:59-2641(-)